MNHCEHCPLKETGGRCPSEDYRSYCKHVANERGQPYGHWTTKLLREAGEPRRKAHPCEPDEPPVQRPRRAGLVHELVVAKWKEDVRWVNDCPIEVALYDKCPASGPARYGPHVAVRHLPNKGREAGTMLRHVVECYDELAEWTYFVQGNTHSGAELFGRLATPYADTTALTAMYLPDFPSPEVKALDRVEWHGDYEVRYGDARFHGNRSPAENEGWLGAVWDQWFEGERPDPWHFAYCAEIAVPRHRIRQRPLAFWRSALARLEDAPTDPSTWSLDPGNAWAFELIWAYLFGDPARYRVKTPRPPGLLRKVGDFVGAAGAQLMAGNPQASEAVQQERRAACFACTEWHDHRADACTHCGCGQDRAVVAVGIDMDLKRRWATSSCPVGKWKAVQ